MIPALDQALRKEWGLDEGDQARVYDDKTGKPIGRGTTVQGFPTIGIGRNLLTRGLLDSEIELLYSNDRDECERDLDAALPWMTRITINRQVVLYSLYFNMYLGNVRLFLKDWPHFIEQMRIGAYEDAAHNLETSQPWASEVGSRAARLAQLIRSG